METNKLIVLLLAITVFSCSQEENSIDEKKAQLEAFKKEAADLTAQIATLEKEIATLDPDFAKVQRKSILVTTAPVETGHFAHYVEITGSVLSKKNVNISAEVSGRVQEIKAVEGMRVNKGDVLAEVDAETIENNIAEVEKQLELAWIVFEKQKRLWDQQIGTEMQFLEAKNRMEVLEKSVATMSIQKDRTA